MSDDFGAKLQVASELIQKFTYPLLSLDDKKQPVLFASCIFLGLGDKHFLVTAAHALRSSPTNLWTRGRNTLIQVQGKGTLSRADTIDHFDIAAVRIDDQFIQHHGIETIPVTNLSMAIDVSNPHCRAICGFPVSMNKQTKSLERSTKTFTGKHLTYFGFAEYDGDFSSFGKSSSVHVGLDYRSGIDQDGRKGRGEPEFHGDY